MKLGKQCFMVAALLILLSGCFNVRQPQSKIDYYTLEYDPPVVTEAPKLPFILKIEPFSTSPVYDSTRILYREKAFKRSEYAYHKWRAAPGDLTAALLARDFAAASLFKAVIFAETVPAYSHVLSGKVEEFYQHSENEPWEAVLSLSITLSGFMTHDIQDAVLFQKRFTAREKCSRSTPESFVEAMSRALQQLSGRIIRDVCETLNDQRH